jgi:hypothetical protein
MKSIAVAMALICGACGDTPAMPPHPQVSEMGVYIHASDAWFRMREGYADIACTSYSSVFAGDRWYTVAELRETLNAAIAQSASNSVFVWSIGDDGGRTTISVNPGKVKLPEDPPQAAGMDWSCGWEVADALGWSSGWFWLPPEDDEGWAHDAITFTVGPPEFTNYWLATPPDLPLAER